jgi:hypothetical protein
MSLSIQKLSKATFSIIKFNKMTLRLTTLYHYDIQNNDTQYNAYNATQQNNITEQECVFAAVSLG